MMLLNEKGISILSILKKWCIILLAAISLVFLLNASVRGEEGEISEEKENSVVEGGNYDKGKISSKYEVGAGYMILLFGKLWGEKLPIMGGPLLSIRYDLFDMWRGRILGMEDVAVRLGGKTRLGTAGSLQKGKQSIFYLLDVLSVNLSASGKLNLFGRKSNLNLSLSTANFGINLLTYGGKRGLSINPVSINIDFSLAFDLKNFGTGIFLFLNPIDVFSTNTFLDENDNEIYGIGKLRMIRLASGFILLF